MDMFSEQPRSTHDVIDRLFVRYNEMIESGQYRPFIYPWETIGAAVVLAYLLIDHRNSPRFAKARYPVFGFICLFALRSIVYCRAQNPAAAFGVGLISAWSILWCSKLLLLGDAQTDFRRIERTERRMNGSAAPNKSNGATSTGIEGSTYKPNGLTRRQNGSTRARDDDLGTTETPAQRKGVLAWQSYPSVPFIERLDWVADIFCNFRGMGWNWQISGLPPPPEWVQDELDSGHSNGDYKSEPISKTSHIGITRYHTRSSLVREAIYIFTRNYFILDILKTLIAHDPYFWGIESPPPPAYLPVSLQAYPVLVNSVRLLISLAAIRTALQFIFSLGPIFFVGILGPSLLGVRGEPWLCPDHFGSFTLVLDKGLAGWWGGWWHQVFRAGFEGPASAAVKAMKLDPKSQMGKFVQLCVAFTLSGCLHAAGSYTQIGFTSPFWGPMRFFLLQVVGITVQMLWAMGLKKMGLAQRMPTWISRTGNFVYVHVWMYYTAPLLVDDFAKGGIWLFEPIPFSPLRGLGFGSKDDGWFQWGGQLVRWHRGEHWWDTGIAL